MRAIVTGGAGFIGSHVTDALLARGDEVWVVDNLASGKRERVPDAATFAELDIRDAAALGSLAGEVRPHVVFHLPARRPRAWLRQRRHALLRQMQQSAGQCE